MAEGSLKLKITLNGSRIKLILSGRSFIREYIILATI